VLGRAPTMLLLREAIVWLIFVEIEACVPIKMNFNYVVHFSIDEMAQEPYEGFYEHSYNN
jgi:hypothetical protein